MAVSTTQSIWRSGGGDNTRQAYCGTGVMAATFFVANAAVSGNVVVAQGQTAQLILPANAVVTHVMITDALTSGTINVGYVTVDGATNNASYLANGASAVATITPGSAGNGAGLGLVMNATKNVKITTESKSSAVGNVGGIIFYYVTDPLFGQQNN
jgi:hypothetical protein